MRARGWFAVRAVLTLVVVAGLAVDVYIHFDLASTYGGVRSSQETLFRFEGAIAALAAVALIVRPRR